MDGLCVMPAQAVIQCPDHYITVCNKKDRLESPCCAKPVTAERISICPNGTEFQDGYCTRFIAHQPIVECPVGFGLTETGTQCVQEEIGEPVPICVPPDVLSPDGDSCITTVEKGFEYVCPDDYACISYSIKKKKKYSPMCSACAKTTETLPRCGCPPGLQEVEGFCYDPDIYALCQTRPMVPRKQAPSKNQIAYPSKDVPEPEPEIDCSPVAPVACQCQLPFSLECSGKLCRCLHREVLPTMPICRGELDEGGNCLIGAKKQPGYTCQEGFTCDVINKKGQCRCARILVADPISRCLVGEPHDNRCIEVIKEDKVVECPPGYNDDCCDNQCQCTKTLMAVRQIKCEDGAVNIQGQCAYVSKPSPGCYEVSFYPSWILLFFPNDLTSSGHASRR